MHLSATAALFAGLALPSLVLADHGGHQAHRRHEDIAMHAVEKRDGSARYSYYDITTGEVACGGYYQPSDFVVALNSGQFGDGENCGKTITISYKGKTTQAKIVDECPGCPWFGLDLTEGLFSYFAPTSEGLIYGDWNFGGAPAPPPPPPPKPAATWHPPATTKPKPTSTWQPPPVPTSTKQHTTSASSSIPAPTSANTSMAPKSTSPVISAPVTHDPQAVVLGLGSELPPEQAKLLTNTQNLGTLDNAMANFGVLILSA